MIVWLLCSILKLQYDFLAFIASSFRVTEEDGFSKTDLSGPPSFFWLFALRNSFLCFIWNFGFRQERRLYYIYEAKTKVLISCAVIAQLICTFVFANAKSRFSLDAALICNNCRSWGSNSRPLVYKASSFNTAAWRLLNKLISTCMYIIY